MIDPQLGEPCRRLDRFLASGIFAGYDMVVFATGGFLSEDIPGKVMPFKLRQLIQGVGFDAV